MALVRVNVTDILAQYATGEGQITQLEIEPIQAIDKDLRQIMFTVKTLTSMSGEPVSTTLAAFGAVLSSPVTLALLGATAVWTVSHPKQALTLVNAAKTKAIDWTGKLKKFKADMGRKFSPGPQKPWMSNLLKSTGLALLGCAAVIHGEKILDTSKAGLATLSTTVTTVPKTLGNLTLLALVGGSLYLASKYLGK